MRPKSSWWVWKIWGEQPVFLLQRNGDVQSGGDLYKPYRPRLAHESVTTRPNIKVTAP